MCDLNPLGNALTGLLIQAGTQMLAQVDWNAVMVEMLEGDKPKPVTLNSPNDLKTWLCQQCANGQIAPETLAQAMTLLCQMEQAQKAGNQQQVNNSVVALRRIIA